MSALSEAAYSPAWRTDPQWRRLSELLADSATPSSVTHGCYCVGPQNGAAKCPCALRAEADQNATMLRDGVTIAGKRYRLVPA